jgi:CubicO group peptidase (beta-lactamase class C family)
MRSVVRAAKIVCLLVILLIAAAGLWLTLMPPELLRVGSGYAAKMVCSNVFIAGRNPDEVLAVDVQAPGNPLLKLMRVSVDREARRVHAGFFWVLGGNEAVYREGLGCTVRPDGKAPPAIGVAPVVAAAGDPDGADLLWPEGQKVYPNESVMTVLSDPALTGPGMRAVVVVKGGRVVGEAYGEGFSASTPLIGWSMTKTVNAAIIGTLIRDGRMALADRDLAAAWRGSARATITLANLLAMESGLEFNEDYGTVADVTRMLFLESDMARFVADKPLVSAPGSAFNYSSGTSTLVSKLWMEAIGTRSGGRTAALSYPRRALFDPIGMKSAVMETDAEGTFVGSSYLYATARDWARFGLLLSHDGVWNGNRILPEGFVSLMQTPNGHSGGRFTQMQTWLPSRDGAVKGRMPPDTFYLSGHDGQTVAVMPSLDLVVVRMGLTPGYGNYDPGFLAGTLAAMPAGALTGMLNATAVGR